MNGLDLVRRSTAVTPSAEHRAIPRGRTEPAPLLLSSEPGERMSANRALGLADVWACVNCLAQSVASLPLQVFRPAPGGRERVRGGRLAELIERPSPATTTAGFTGQVMTSLALHGNVFIAKYRQDGVVAQLGVLDPATITVSRVNGEPRYELYRPEGVTRHGLEDILHIRSPVSLDGLVGLSPIGVVRQALTHADALSAMGRTFAENAARPSGVLKLDRHASQGQVEMLKDTFRAHHGGPGRAGGIAVLSGEVEWTQLALSLEDAAYIESRKLSTAEIARIFRIPPWLIGAPSGDSLTYSSTEMQSLAFVVHTLRPWLVCIESAFSADADLAVGNQYAEFILDGLLRGDSKTRAEIYASALNPQTGWMTRAEVRQLENLAPEPDEPPIVVRPPAEAVPTNGGAVA